jgi:hypothetical protein
MIHVLEALWGLWIACASAQGSNRPLRPQAPLPRLQWHRFVDQVMQVEPLVTRKRICHACRLRGYV